MGRTARAVGRGVVFVVGAVFGYLTATVLASYPGGGPQAVIYLQIYSPLALAVMAPICWYFAVRGAAGDRWTIGYLLAWATWFAVLLLAVAIF